MACGWTGGWELRASTEPASGPRRVSETERVLTWEDRWMGRDNKALTCHSESPFHTAKHSAPYKNPLQTWTEKDRHPMLTERKQAQGGEVTHAESRPQHTAMGWSSFCEHGCLISNSGPLLSNSLSFCSGLLLGRGPGWPGRRGCKQQCGGGRHPLFRTVLSRFHLHPTPPCSWFPRLIWGPQLPHFHQIHMGRRWSLVSAS